MWRDDARLKVFVNGASVFDRVEGDQLLGMIDPDEDAIVTDSVFE